MVAKWLQNQEAYRGNIECSSVPYVKEETQVISS